MHSNSLSRPVALQLLLLVHLQVYHHCVIVIDHRQLSQTGYSHIYDGRAFRDWSAHNYEFDNEFETATFNKSESSIAANLQYFRACLLQNHPVEDDRSTHHSVSDGCRLNFSNARTEYPDEAELQLHMQQLKSLTAPLRGIRWGENQYNGYVA
jgi:hypothetical protein